MSYVRCTNQLMMKFSVHEQDQISVTTMAPDRKKKAQFRTEHTHANIGTMQMCHVMFRQLNG